MRTLYEISYELIMHSTYNTIMEITGYLGVPPAKILAGVCPYKGRILVILGLVIYGHYNQCYHMIQNCNDGEELQRWYLNCKALSKFPEFCDELLWWLTDEYWGPKGLNTWISIYRRTKLLLRLPPKLFKQPSKKTFRLRLVRLRLVRLRLKVGVGRLPPIGFELLASDRKRYRG